MVELADKAKQAYDEMLNEHENEEKQTLLRIKIQQNNLNNMQNTIKPTVPSHLGHSRTPSGGGNIQIDPSLINYMSHHRTPSGNYNYLSNLTNAAKIASSSTSATTTATVVTTSGHSRNPSSGGGGHSRNPSNGGNVNTSGGGHSRNASGSGGTFNIDFNSGALFLAQKHFTHSRTHSNCSNISFVSRMSEPISEIGGPTLANTNLNSITQATNNSTAAVAVQNYTELVRNEMRENDNAMQETQIHDDNSNDTVNENLSDEDEDNEEIQEEQSDNDENQMNEQQNETNDNNNNTTQALSCIHEIDAGNEADIDDEDDKDATLLQAQQKRSRLNSKCSSNTNGNNNSTTQQNDDDLKNIEHKLNKITLIETVSINDDDK